MRTLLATVAALLVSLTAGAEEPKTLTGSFLMNVDDHATVFVNGQNVFHGNLGVTRSKELTLTAGDRIVLHLTNDRGPKHFILVFESSDAANIVSFKATDFRIVPEAGVNDFDPASLGKWKDPAKKLPGHKGLEKQLKNYSDWMWGDIDRCTLAGMLTPRMFTQTPK